MDSGDQYVVDLTECTRSCRRYDLTGIPCNHAIVAINYKKEKLEDYVDVCYSKVIYLKIFGHLIQPMNRMLMWEVAKNPPIQPYLYIRQLKKKRNKELAQGKIKGPLKYGICKKEGHNTRTHHMHLSTR
ncbi:hypothetical protein DVH24_030174 [Malus domestica]|uniref:SWIM-type domain-containing protein n=1 Tax=Malus domestica TaxID=3750 RepID=A0A498I306_MALDO|nr:hypothetical protein DVH24_030174 [Malus domestica]